MIGLLGEDRTLSSSLILLVLERPFLDAAEDEKEAFLCDLLGSFPLAMVFFGGGSSLAFDFTLKLQSKREISPHTMTKLSSMSVPKEAIEDFLQATWPSEERFDEWKSYSVLVVGDERLQDEMHQTLEAILR